MILPFLLAALAQGAPALQASASATAQATTAQSPADAEHPTPCDPKDGQALLLGSCTREQILAHRAVFKERTEQAEISPALRKRWMAVQKPFVLVVAFGSWCGDSQHEVPDFLALDSQENPFVEVHFIGVARDKAIAPAAWPAGLPAQKAEKVPSFWLFLQQPGGGEKLVGSVIEHPSKDGEKMSEAVLDMIEAAK